MLGFVLQRKHYGVAKMLIAKGNGKPTTSWKSVADTGKCRLGRGRPGQKGKPSQAAFDKTYETALDQKQTEHRRFAEEGRRARAAAAVRLDPKVLESYAGTYKTDQLPFDIKVFIQGMASCYFQATGQPEFAPKAKSPTIFEFPQFRSAGRVRFGG